MRLRNAALAYAGAGWAVFPLKPGEKVPAVKHGVKEATTDLAQVGEWWQREYNIGVACGEPSGLFVLDVDGEVGLDSLVRLGHGFPATLCQTTPSGGWHFVFQHLPGLRNTAGTLGEKLDTRGDGGYIVAAPSVVNGVQYRWLGKSQPQPLPGWLLTLLRPPRKERQAPLVRKADLGGYAGKAATIELHRVETAPEGTRNHTLNKAAFSLGTLVGAGLLGVEDVRARLVDAGLACGLPELEVRSTVDRGLADGQQHPRHIDG